MWPARKDPPPAPRAARRPRAAAALLAGLALGLAVLAALVAGCGRGGPGAGGGASLRSDDLQTADALEARQTVERFLSELARGKYDDAAKDYSGDLTLLRDLSWMVAPDDVAELLRNYCTRHHGACLPARVVEGRLLGPGSYEFDVEFLDTIGRPVVIGDTMMAQSLASRFTFRVQRIGVRYYVLDLPPRLR
jgi:hypothetical protein